MWRFLSSSAPLAALFFGVCILPQVAPQPGPPPVVYPKHLDLNRNVLYIRCTVNQMVMWDNAWTDAIQLASAAWTVMVERRNEPLVSSYWFAITDVERQAVEATFQLAIHSDSFGPGHRYNFCCGDFQPGDDSTSGVPVFEVSRDCEDPGTNGYSRLFGLPSAPFYTTTNDIAGCAMLNPDRTGRIVMGPDPITKQRFCDETDFPHLRPSEIGLSRRLYFRGWSLLHELTHSATVGYLIVSQGPGDRVPHAGTSDFTYDQLLIANLEGFKAVGNAESYANFAWDAFFWMTCGKRPLNMVDLPVRGPDINI